MIQKINFFYLGIFLAILCSLQSQTVLAVAPSVTTETATSTASGTERLRATITDFAGAAASQRGFQYGRTTSYGSTTSTSGSYTLTFGFIKSFGSSGTSNGQFSIPTHISIDASGNVFVIDYNNNRIEKFASTGVYQSQFGSYGTGNGEFSAPTGIAISTSTGNIYVTDSGNYRAQIFDSTGVYQSQFGTNGTGNGQFSDPAGIAINTTGTVYVVDSGNNRIQKFSATGTYQGKWGSAGTGNSQFQSPVGIAIDTANYVYVADSNNNRIQKFDANGVYQTQWGSAGSGNGQFNLPTAIALDASGNVYVTDQSNARVQEFTSSGVFVTSWGPALNSGEGLLDVPYGIAINSSTGSIYVSDYNGNNVNVYGQSGFFSQTIASLDCADYHYRAFAVNADGTSYGDDATFTTSCSAPSVSTASASAVSGNGATLNGSITSLGGGNAPTRGFQYGLTTSYGSTVTQNGSYSASAFNTDLSSLSCGTAYHYRSYATNSNSTAYGSDSTFTTDGCGGGFPFPSAGGGSGIVMPVTPPWQAPAPVTTIPLPVVTPATTPAPNSPVAAVPAAPFGSDSIRFASVFTRPLHLGGNTTDTKNLQQFLNTHGFMVATSGNGSPGKETTYFGKATRQALIRFQEAHAAEILTPLGLTHGTGNFGPSTRAFINTLVTNGQ